METLSMEQPQTVFDPCPFCGSQGVTVGYEGQPAVNLFCVCTGCGATGPKFSYARNMTFNIGEAWNIRKPSESKPELAPQADPPRLSDPDIDTVAQSMPGGLDSFAKLWGWRQFARAIEDEVLIKWPRASQPDAWISPEELNVLRHNASVAISPEGMKLAEQTIPVYIGAGHE